MITDSQNVTTHDSIMFFPSGPIPCKQIIISVNLDEIRVNKSISCNWAFQLQK